MARRGSGGAGRPSDIEGPQLYQKSDRQYRLNIRLKISLFPSFAIRVKSPLMAKIILAHALTATALAAGALFVGGTAAVYAFDCWWVLGYCGLRRLKGED